MLQWQFLMISLRAEGALAQSQLAARATIVSPKGRYRAVDLTYGFVAMDGKSYEGETSVSRRQKALPDELAVLYNPPDLAGANRKMISYSTDFSPIETL